MSTCTAFASASLALLSLVAGCAPTAAPDAAEPVAPAAPLDDTWAAKMGMQLTAPQGSPGARVTQTRDAEFARVIGLQPGDLIVALNDRPVASPAGFEGIATGFARGGLAAGWDGAWTFAVQRGGKTLTLKPAPGYDCNPFILAECGPLSRR